MIGHVGMCAAFRDKSSQLRLRSRAPEAFVAQLQVPGHELWIMDIPDVAQILERAVWTLKFELVEGSYDWHYRFKRLPRLRLEGREISRNRRQAVNPSHQRRRSGGRRRALSIGNGAHSRRPIWFMTAIGISSTFRRGSKIRRNIWMTTGESGYTVTGFVCTTTVNPEMIGWDWISVG